MIDGYEPVVSTRAIEFCQTHYWVLAFPNHLCTPWNWLFSLTEPAPVPNPQMHWRRPTYPEIEERQRYWDEQRHWFEERHDGHLAKYRKPRLARRNRLLLSDLPMPRREPAPELSL